MVGVLTFLAWPIGRGLLLAVLVVGSYAAAYWKGRQAGWDAREQVAQQEMAEVQRAAAVLAGNRAAVTERVVVKYRDRVQTVVQQGEEVIREVEKLVPVDSCDLPGGWRVLHDAAASGRFPEPAGRAPAAPVDAQTVARTVAENYASCRADQERLTALQEWVQQQEIVR